MAIFEPNCLFSFIFSSVHVGALPVYPLPHLIILCLLSLHFSVAIHLPAYLLFYLYRFPSNWQSSPLFVLCQHCPLSFFLATVYLHNHLFNSSVCSWPPPPPPNFPPLPLICHSDYSGWWGLVEASFMAKYMNIYMNAKASSDLFVCFCLIEMSAKSLYCWRMHVHRCHE